MDDTQLLRYSRHILLTELGIDAQERFAAAHALIVGAGGLGAPAAQFLAAAGIGGFSKILHFVEKNAPLRRGVTTEEVGNACAFLLSDLASGITGETVYVDAGFSTTTAGLEE